MKNNTTLLKYGKAAMLKYGSFVIEDRSLPDFRDGLKPVQRRSLWALYKLGLTPDKPHKKAARIVGEVIGKYHPHGDQAVYGTLVRMSGVPENKLRQCPEPLIEGSGNWGSMEEPDSYAADSYRLDGPDCQ